MKNTFKELFAKLDIMQFMVASVFLFIFVNIVNALIYRNIPEANSKILVHVLGIVEGVLMTIATYYYGSSKGSAKKTEMIDKQMDNTINEINEKK